MTTYNEVAAAAAEGDTICPACGTRGGEAGYECFYCEDAVVRDAGEIQRILDLIEEDTP